MSSGKTANQPPTVLGKIEKRLPKGGRRKAKRGRFGELYLGALIPVLLLVVYGIVVIWSASLTISEASFPRHLAGIAIGLVAAAFVWRHDYRVMQTSNLVLFIAIVVLIFLPSVPGFGYSAKGMTGWVKIPFIGLRFQPSEIVKLLSIFLMSSLGAQYNGKINTLREYLTLCGVLTSIFILMITQDLGTSLIIFVVGAAIVICSGAKRSWVLITIGIVVAGAALGSGGFFGKGIGNATQAGSGFLPEAHTDFVFALLAEEFGFLGAILLLLLFAWAVFATISLAQRLDSPYAKLILAGIATMWTFQLLESVGMCIGIMPITGIPLPFISFGSSSMVVQLTAAGVVQSIWLHRQKSA
jgi:rod shape determining protein RodA